MIEFVRSDGYGLSFRLMFMEHCYGVLRGLGDSGDFSLKSVLELHGAKLDRVVIANDVLDYKEFGADSSEYHFLKATAWYSKGGEEEKIELRPYREGSEDDWADLMMDVEADDLLIHMERLQHRTYEGKMLHDRSKYGTVYYRWWTDWLSGDDVLVPFFEPVWSGVSMKGKWRWLAGDIVKWNAVDGANYEAGRQSEWEGGRSIDYMYFKVMDYGVYDGYDGYEWWEDQKYMDDLLYDAYDGDLYMYYIRNT